MPPTVDDVRYDLAMTRARMAATLEELDERLGEQKEAARGKVAQVKARLDLRDAAREHPWIAIGAAMAVGMLVAGSGADRRAATATVDAARALPDAAKSAGGAVVEKVKDLRAGHGEGDGDAAALADAAQEEGPGFFDRIASRLGDALQLDRFVAEIAKASRELGARAAGGSSLDRRVELSAQSSEMNVN